MNDKEQVVDYFKNTLQLKSQNREHLLAELKQPTRFDGDRNVCKRIYETMIIFGLDMPVYRKKSDAILNMSEVLAKEIVCSFDIGEVSQNVVEFFDFVEIWLNWYRNQTNDSRNAGKRGRDRGGCNYETHSEPETETLQFAGMP